MAVFVLMGVSGSGKSTVGRRVAEALALTFIEGDDFHPQANVQKMAGGTPLTDEDLNAKFIELAAPVLGKPRAERLLARLWKIDTMAVRDL